MNNDINARLHPEKSHHRYDKTCIGGSDYAALTMTGFIKGKGVSAKVVEFGSDGLYYAYVVDEAAIIPDSYQQVAEFNSWVRFYDDEMMMRKFYADCIRVYRRGVFGCIIQLIGGKNE